MAKKEIDNEPMLEETSDEILLEESSCTEAMLEETSDSEVLLEEDLSESVLLEEDSDGLLEEAVDKATKKAADEERYKAARERSRKEAEAERRRIADEERYKAARVQSRKEAEAERRRIADEERYKAARVQSRKEAEAERRRIAEEQAKKRKAEEKARMKKEESNNRKMVAGYVIAVLLGLLSGTLMAFGMKDENTSWGESLALGYTLGLVAFFAIVWGILSIIGVDSEGKECEKWRILLCRCIFALSTIGVICYSIFKGTFNLNSILISIFVGLFIASCANGLSHFVGRSK